MILRGLAGLILGIGYGLLVGAIIWLLIRLTAENPGPMIPDNNGWGEMLMWYVTLLTGGCGALVGLGVGSSGGNKIAGGVIGVIVGLIPLVYFLSGSAVGLTKLSVPEWLQLLTVLVLFLLILPVGLGVTGMVVSMIASKLKL